jgi:hypothetical protein
MYKSSVGERTRRWGGDQDNQQTDQELISTPYPSYPRTKLSIHLTGVLIQRSALLVTIQQQVSASLL